MGVWRANRPTNATYHDRIRSPSTPNAWSQLNYPNKGLNQPCQ